MRTRLTLLAPVWLIFAGSVLGQCVLDPIRVGRVEGYLLFGFQNNYRLLDKGEIQLLEPVNTQTVVASITVDKDGRFEIVSVKLGKYILSVRSEGLIPTSVDVTVTKSKRAPGHQLILVVLSADATRECGGASIKVHPKAEVDRLLGTATRP